MPAGSSSGAVSAERLDQGVAAPPVHRPHPAQVSIELAADEEVGERQLVDDRRAAVGEQSSRAPRSRPGGRARRASPAASPGQRLARRAGSTRRGPAPIPALLPPAPGRSGTPRRSRPRRRRRRALGPARAPRRAAPAAAPRRWATGAPAVSTTASAPARSRWSTGCRPRRPGCRPARARAATAARARRRGTGPRRAIRRAPREPVPGRAARCPAVAVADHDVVRSGRRAAHPVEVVARAPRAVRVRRARRGRRTASFGVSLARLHRPQPGRPRELGRRRCARTRSRSACGAAAAGAAVAPAAGASAATWRVAARPAGEVALGHELLVGLDHDTARDPEAGRERAGGAATRRRGAGRPGCPSRIDASIWRCSGTPTSRSRSHQQVVGA